MLALNDDALERTHDYIQWLFPLETPSSAVADAPVLEADEVQAIRESIAAQCALAAATDRMDVFYRRTRHWLRPGDHNHLRITRIIKSLRRLRGDEQADAFRAAILARVRETGAPVGARTLGYWLTA